MSTLLEVPAIRERLLPITVERYHRLTEGEATELLRGTIIEKVSKSPLHSGIALRLSFVLSRQIDLPLLLLRENPLSLAESEPEPDLCVVRSTFEEVTAAHPHTAELVIEVAVSSLEIDRIKAGIYAEAAVGEYWIVCPEAKMVEVYRERKAGEWTSVTQVAEGCLTCAALPEIRVDLAWLFS